MSENTVETLWNHLDLSPIPGQQYDRCWRITLETPLNQAPIAHCHLERVKEIEGLGTFKEPSQDIIIDMSALDGDELAKAMLIRQYLMELIEPRL